LSYAVAQAYASGQTALRLALYSSDGGLHSGKFFWTSEMFDPQDGWTEDMVAGRPTLAVGWGNP
jgi:hypothetical protein